MTMPPRTPLPSPQSVLSLEPGPRADTLHVELWDHNNVTSHTFLGSHVSAWAAT
jgi:hypothetical protein